MDRFIERDAKGNVSGVTRWPSSAGQESLPEDHPEVEAYLNRPAQSLPATPDEIVDALSEIATAAGLPAEGRKKLDALLSRR